MRYFIYLRRSLTRAWRAHMLLVLLLACAMAFPLGLSILDAGYVQGIVAQNYQWSQGHGAVVHNAEHGDETLFASIKGVVPVWGNGKLWLDRTADNPIVYENGEKKLNDDFHVLPWRVVEEAGRTDLYIEFVEDPCCEVPEHAVSTPIRLTVLAFSAITMLIAYLSFWYNHANDIHALERIGATGGQLLLLRFVEMLFSHSTAGTLSCFLSSQAIRFLTENYIGFDMHGMNENINSTTRWFVYTTPWCEMVSILFILLAVAVISLGIWCGFYQLQKYCLLRRKLHLYIPLRSRALSSLALQSVFSRRGTWRVYISTILILPFLICAVLLYQLRAPIETAKSTAPEFDISVMLNHATCAVWEDSLHFLTELPGVERVAFGYYPITRYIIRDDSVDMIHGDFDVAIHGMQTRIYADEALRLPSPETRENGVKIYNAAINNKDNSIKAYTIGDELEMTLPSNAGAVYVRIAAVLDPSQEAERETTLQTVGIGSYIYQNTLHFNPFDFEEIIQKKDVSSFSICMHDKSQSQDVIDVILNTFSGNAILLIENHYTEYLVTYNRAVGMNLLYTTLSALLFLFFAVITTLSLIDYAASHRETLRLLHMQGASHRAIIAAFVEILLPPAILTCAAVWAIVTPVERAYYRLRGYTDALMEKMDLRMIDDPRYLLAALAVAAVFVVPAVVTVARELRKLERM